MAGCAQCGAPAPSGDGRFRRVLWLALAVNGTMFLVEIVASLLSGSMALQADALDFLGDSLNYAISLAVVGMALQVRARAALVKGASMAAFGLWVLSSTVYRIWAGAPPDAGVMGAVGLAALAANLGVAAALFRYRGGDSNMRSIWLCSRNDALGNVAVLLAAGGVFATGTHWPDLLVAGLVAGLNLSAAVQVTRHALREMASSRHPAATSSHRGHSPPAGTCANAPSPVSLSAK